MRDGKVGNKVSTFGSALHRLWTKCRQRGGQLHGIGGSLLRSRSRAVSPRCAGGHVKKSSCDFSVLSGPGVLYHVPITCTNTTGRSEQLFPDSAESSTPDFGPSEASPRT